jgi:dodecin
LVRAQEAYKGKSGHRPGRNGARGDKTVSVAKIIEISAESTKSFEDAVRQGIERAEKSLKNVRGAWISEQKVNVENGKITNFRVIMRVSFVLE